MNRRICIISLAVVLAGLAAVLLNRMRLSGAKAESAETSGVAVSQISPSTSSVTNDLACPIPATQASPSVSNLEILNDRSASIQSRVSVADSFGKSRSSNAVASLIVIVGDESENVVLRYKAARALGNIGDQTAASALSNLLLSSTVDQHLRIVSALALGNIGGTDAVQALTGAAIDSDSIIRFKAIQGLMRTHEKAAVAPVVKAMRDQDADVQTVAIQAYGVLAGSGGVANIRDTLDGTDSVFIKIACLDALGEAGGAEAESILLAYVENSNELLRVNAQKALHRAKEAAAQ